MGFQYHFQDNYGHRCKPMFIFQVAGMEAWCRNNCNHNPTHCPRSHCRCQRWVDKDKNIWMLLPSSFLVYLHHLWNFRDVFYQCISIVLRPVWDVFHRTADVLTWQLFTHVRARERSHSRQTFVTWICQNCFILICSMSEGAVKLFSSIFSSSIFLHLNIEDKIQSWLKFVSKLIETCFDKGRGRGFENKRYKRKQDPVSTTQKTAWTNYSSYGCDR